MKELREGEEGMIWVVDTCVVIDLVERDGEFGAVSAAALASKIDDSFVITPITYVELGPVFDGDRERQDAFLREISANQSEVSAERYKSVSYVGLPLGTQGRLGLRGFRTQHMFGYCKFNKDENAKMLGYRIEMWYKGGCVAAYDTLRPSDIKKLQIPEDWHVSFKHPQKFKYRSPFSSKAAVRY